MNPFTRFVSQAFKGALKAFQTFPAAIGCALAFAIVTMISIQLDWTQQEAINFLLSSLHWSFALGALVSLTAITAAQSLFNTKKSFHFGNFLGLAIAAVAFLLLYFFGGTTSSSASGIIVVSDLAMARVIVVMLVSLFVFIILAAYPKDQSDFAQSFFMTHKAFFIALLYGVVIMAGTAGVARTVQALLYNGMSGKIYMYLGTLSGFTAFTIFLGYFPDFRKGHHDEHRNAAQNQPRFIEILFDYIMVPIFLALTAVLLIWALRTGLSGMEVSFSQLAGIAATYTLGGLWLHIMVTHHETGLSKLYRRFYPIAALVILVFEAWALINQLQYYGLKTTAYFFILLWVVAAVSAVLLLIIKAKAHLPLVVLICVLAVFSVLPVIGFQPLSVTVQTNRLTTLLVAENILQDGQLVPATVEPEQAVQEKITDAVNYLAGVQEAKLPSWFVVDLNSSEVFEEKLGFEQTWQNDAYLENGDSFVLSLTLPSSALDISDYQWAVNFSGMDTEGNSLVTISSEKGTYDFYWIVDANTGIPTLKILLNDNVIYEEDMSAYIDEMTAKYPADEKTSQQPAATDMYLTLETSELKMLLVFSYIEGYVDLDPAAPYYNITLNTLYLNEED